MCRKLARCRPNIVIVFGLTDLKQTVGAGKTRELVSSSFEMKIFQSDFLTKNSPQPDHVFKNTLRLFIAYHLLL